MADNKHNDPVDLDEKDVTPEMASSMPADATDGPTVTTAAPRAKKPKRPTNKKKKKAPKRDLGPEGDDLFDRIEPFWAKTKARLGSNMLNIGVVATLLLLIVMANWITQPQEQDAAQQSAAEAVPAVVEIINVEQGDLAEEAVDAAAEPAAAPLEVAPAAPVKFGAGASITAALDPGATTAQPVTRAATDTDTYQPTTRQLHREFLHDLDGPAARNTYQQQNRSQRVVKRRRRSYYGRPKETVSDRPMLSYYDRVAVGQQVARPKSSSTSATSSSLITERTRVERTHQLREDFQQADTFDVRY